MNIFTENLNGYNLRELVKKGEFNEKHVTAE